MKRPQRSCCEPQPSAHIPGFRRGGFWSASQSNFGRLEMSSEEGKGNRCVLVLLYEWVSSSEYVVHMHRHSLCFYCSTITTQPKPAVQHAHLRPPLDYRGPSTTLTRHWKPCLQLADLASTLMATNWKSKNHVRDDNKGFLASFFWKYN